MKNAKRLATPLMMLLLSPLFIPAASSDEGVHTDNIVVILDASGSMGDDFSSDPTKTKMEAAKEALREVLAKIPDGTNIGLLVFSGSNVKNEWVYPLSPKNDEKLMEAINLPIPGGGTPLGKSIKVGADRLLEQREKQYNYGGYRLLIVTDGEADDPEKVSAYTPKVMERQIRVDVIGVDMKQDHMLARVVDSYRRADNPGQLVKAVSDILAETPDTGMNTSGEDVFEYIGPLTTDVALSLIAAITQVPGNSPISEEPTAPETTTVSTSRTGQNGIDATPASGQTERNFLPLLIGILVFGAIAIWVLTWFFRTGQRGRGS